MGKKASNPEPPEGAEKPTPPPAPPARKTKSVWNISIPYLIDLMDADNDDIREVIIKKGCCVGMTTSLIKP